MLDRLRDALEAEADVAYALVFGSTARGTRTPSSDVDVGIELRPGAPRDAAALGALVSRLETATRAPIDLVLLDEARPAVAYRAFRDGCLLVVHDRAALTARRARSILLYLDFAPVEALCVDGVLRAAARGR